MSDGFYDSLFADKARQQELRAQPAAQTDPTYDAYFADQQAQGRERLKKSLGIALQETPDAVAKRKALSDQTGVPLDVVARNEETVALQNRVRELQSLASDNPYLARQLEDPAFAALAHDNAENLGLVESLIRHMSGAARSLAAGGLTDFNAAAWGTAEAGAKFVGATDAGALFNRLRKAQEALGKTIQGDYGQGIVEGGVSSGFRSFGAQLPAAIASLLTGNPTPMLSVGSFTAGGQAAGKGLDKGISGGHALLYGAQDAVAEWATELIPVTRLFKDIKAGAPLYKLLGHQIAAEVPGEMVATAWQNFNEWANVNPNESLHDYLQKLGPDEAQTVIATVVQTLLSAGLVGSVGRLARGSEKKQADADRAAQRAAGLAQLMQIAGADRVLQRDPTTFSGFVAGVTDGGPLEHVLISPQVLQQSGVDINALAQLSPTFAAGMQTALETQGEVLVPTAELATTLPGSGLEQAVIPHLRAGEDEMTQAEAQTYMQGQAEEFKAASDKIIAEQGEEGAALADRQAVFDEIKSQLDTANRFTEDVNKEYAAFMANFFTVLANQGKSQGWTAKGLFDTYNVKTQAERVDGAVLDQGKVHRLYDGTGAEFRVTEAPSNAQIHSLLSQGKFLRALQDKATGQIVAMWNSEYATHDQVRSAIGLHDGNLGEVWIEPGDIEKFAEPDTLFQSQSTRRPTTKRGPADHLGEVPLTVDYTKIEPEKNEQNMALVAKYPGIRFKARKAEGRVEEFINHVVENLLWLHDQIPADIRQRSKLWYDGARVITERWAEKYGKTDAQIAAVLAVYSPQKDWFMNVSLAERTLDIVKNHQNTPWSPEMTAVANDILAAEKFNLLRGAIEGKQLSELKDRLEQAAWLRVFDEAHNNRGYRLVTPEGGLVEYATSVKGIEKKTGWPGFGTIVKALYVIDDGSAKTIDNVLGAEHKVRSFYNNIFHPNSNLGFVTIDTHAVAAGLLRPLSGNSIEVTHNFGRAGTATSAATGMSGTYAYYQEAYRRAAKARGLLPREMQSITWEAVRELYTIGFKHDAAKMAVVDTLWSEYEKGKRDLESVRAGILNLAGGVERPAWVGRDSGLSPEGWASTYTGELLGSQLPRRAAGALDAGTGERTAGQSAPVVYGQPPRNSATPEDFAPGHVTGILSKGGWAILTAENPSAQKLSDAENAARMDQLRAELDKRGLRYKEVKGKYGNEENSLLIFGVDRWQALAIGNMFGQESVLTRDGLIYADGTVNQAVGVTEHTTPPDDFYSRVVDTGALFSVDIDFAARRPVSPGFPSHGAANANSISVPAVHFSPQPRATLLTGFVGTGAASQEAARLAEATDPRIKQRLNFYVPEGNGVYPEEGVGSHAHGVFLHNLYDVQADPLRLWRDNPDANSRESAIVDAGFAGYYSRGAFGNQGQAVLLDRQAVSSKYLGTGGVNDQLGTESAPAEPSNPAKALAADVRSARELPAGQQSKAEWMRDLPRLAPALAARIPAEAWEQLPDDKPLYKSDIAKAIYHEDERGQIAFGADITQAPSVITLLKTADLSTFLHETGHFFLEVYADLASRDGTPDQIKADWDRILTWFGLTDEQWRGMTIEQKRPYHEQWARGFESYLFEGKAPSVSLNTMFGKFRAWLKSVYHELVALKVTLTPEVRGVMDRMVATEEQIKITEQARAMAPLFSTKPAGMSDADWMDYQQANSAGTEAAIDELESRSLRNMRWLANARGRVLKALQKDAESKRKEIEKEVRDEVRQQPVYAARRYLKGELKLDIAALEEMYAGEGDRYALLDWSPLTTQKLTQEEGAHPDLVAEMFGFTSGDQLVRELLSAESETSVVDGMTDQRMLERYGDLADLPSLERAADAAVHNEARAKFVAMEYKAVANATGSWQVLVAAAKDAAQRVIGQKKVRELKPAQYSAAEARAAREAAQAMLKGDTVAAATAKRNQLLNNAFAREAINRAGKVEKMLRHFKQLLDSDGTRKNIDIDYRDQIDAILERFDLRTGQSLTAIDKRTSLAEWITKQEEMGLSPAIDERIANEAFRTHYKNLTVEELEGIYDSVRNIEHLGRLKTKLLTAKDQREFAEVVNTIANSIDQNSTKDVPEERVSDRGLLVETARLFKNFMADHRKFASVIRQFDGWKDGGVAWEYLVRVMNERGDFEAVEREKATMHLASLLKPILAGEKLGKKTFFPSSRKSFTREERLGIALNMGNEVNRERVMSGEALSPVQLQEILDSITKEEWDFVQGVWDYFESFKPQMADKERRLTGLEPEWVQPTPVQTRHGTYRGGYYPIKYDPLRSARSEADTVAEVQKQIERGLYTRAQTRRGHLKERAQSTGRTLRYDLGVVAEHVEQVIHDLAWHEWLVDANRLLRAGRIEESIRAHYGNELFRTLRDTLKDIAVGEVGALTAGDKVLNHLRTGATIAGLGWRLTTSLLQPIGLTQSAARIGPKWVAKGAVHWLGDSAKFENSVRLIGEKSEFMRLRAKTLQREISEIRNQVKGEDSKLEASYFYLIQKMQLIADVPTWWGAYEKAMHDTATPDEARAIQLANQAVIDAQGSGQIKDLSAVQRGSPAWKLFTNFYSFFNVTYNLTRESVGRTNFSKPGDVAMLAVDMALLYTIPALLGTLMKVLLSGDWDDPDKVARRLIADQINYLFGTVVGLREIGAIGGNLIDPKHALDYTGPAGVRFFSEVSKLAKQIGQGEADEPFWKSLNSTAGIIFHYPAGQINSTVDGLVALARGKTKNPGALLVGHSDNK